MTMTAIVAKMNAEMIEKSRLFAKAEDGKEHGLLFERPQQANGACSNAEIDKLMHAEPSAFYLAAQPQLKWFEKRNEFVKVQEELLLRARNGGQSFPAVTVYNMDKQRREKFTIYQVEMALKRSAETGIPCSVNFWVQDLLTLKDKVIEFCSGNPHVIIEVTEFMKVGDNRGFPKFASFDDSTVALLDELKTANVRLSLDDVSHVNKEADFPMTFEFALKNLACFSEIKLDIKMMAQIFAELPKVPFAEKFAPLEDDPKVLETKRQQLSEFMDCVWKIRPDMEFVVELSVIDRDVANRFPKLSPFFNSERVCIQGGATNDWAEYIS